MSQLSRAAILSYAKPIKPKVSKWQKTKIWLIFVYNWLLVKLGKRVWARIVYNRPKHLPCGFDRTPMKRIRKTTTGAFYWCNKCKRDYFFECKGQRLVPVISKKKGAK
jgi:hypothetical protein